MTLLDLKRIEDRLRTAVEEDVGEGDVTSCALVSEEASAIGEYRAKEPLVVCGLPVAEAVATMVDARLEFQADVSDGTLVTKGAVLARIQGNARSILAAERTSLNFLQRLSGIATRTRECVTLVEGTQAQILDTRKTAPGLRLLDKYAVACGGGVNHRVGLFDAVLIKNNHLVFCGSLQEAVLVARSRIKQSMTIEVEVSDFDLLREAIDVGVDRVLLDNFTVEETREAVRIARGRVPLESSGGITLRNVRDYAETGVDFISVGSLTHSVTAADIHLLLKPN